MDMAKKSHNELIDIANEIGMPNEIIIGDNRMQLATMIMTNEFTRKTLNALLKHFTDNSIDYSLDVVKSAVFDNLFVIGRAIFSTTIETQNDLMLMMQSMLATSQDVGGVRNAFFDDINGAESSQELMQKLLNEIISSNTSSDRSSSSPDNSPRGEEECRII